MVFISEILAEFIVRLVTPAVAPASAPDGQIRVRTSRPGTPSGATCSPDDRRGMKGGNPRPIAAC
jgi:hypothetical protein